MVQFGLAYLVMLLAMYYNGESAHYSVPFRWVLCELLECVLHIGGGIHHIVPAGAIMGFTDVVWQQATSSFAFLSARIWDTFCLAMTLFLSGVSPAFPFLTMKLTLLDSTGASRKPAHHVVNVERY